ncbi:MAG: hypothetical protein KKD44_13135 [Proteobacteria bacterium]|nr:hypothetical protein [Pseudomonadota bacterium]
MMAQDKYCSLSEGNCPKEIAKVDPRKKVFCAFSSHDPEIVAEVDSAIKTLNRHTDCHWFSWKNDLEIENEIIFCEICSNIATSEAVLTELSDLNFNVVFEYGYSIGLGKKIHPIVNESFDFSQVEKFFQPMLGVGFGKYKTNGLGTKLAKKRFWDKSNTTSLYSFSEQDILTSDLKITQNYLFYIKNPQNLIAAEAVENEVSSQNINIVVDDSYEDSSGISWYAKQLKKSFAVIIDMGDSSTKSEYKHFLKCALIAGIAISTGRRVLIINSIHAPKPSDVLTIIKSYDRQKDSARLIHSFLNKLSNDFAHINAYASTYVDTKTISMFNSIDIGEHVAINDTAFLESAFIVTPEYMELAKPGYKIITGRKGTGKSAAFVYYKKWDKGKNDIVIHQEFDKYDMNDLYDLIEDFGEIGDNDKNKLAAAFWTFTILFIVAKNIYSFIKEEDKIYLSDDEKKGVVQFIEYYDSVELFKKSGTTTEVLGDIITKIRGKNIRDIKELNRNLYREELINLRQEVTSFLCQSKYHLILNIDGLDSNITITKNRSLISLLLHSLHEVCSSIFSNKFKNYTINLFIRTDLFFFFKHLITEKDKINIVDYRWNKELLIKLINKRLKINDIDHIASLMGDELNITQFTQKTDKYVFDRPRDYIYLFNYLIQLAKLYSKNCINHKILNEAINHYAIHISQSIEVEFLSLPFHVDMGDLLSNIKSENNNNDRIPIETMTKICQNLKLDEDNTKTLIHFLLRIEFFKYIENNSPVDWSKLNSPEAKIKIILQSVGRRVKFEFHPIIIKLIETNY